MVVPYTKKQSTGLSDSLTGTGEVTAVTIDPKVVDADDVETLQDLVLGALADLSTKREALAQEKMGPLAGGLGGGLPGLG